MQPRCVCVFFFFLWYACKLANARMRRTNYGAEIPPATRCRDFWFKRKPIPPFSRQKLFMHMYTAYLPCFYLVGHLYSTWSHPVSFHVDLCGLLMYELPKQFQCGFSKFYDTLVVCHEALAFTYNELWRFGLHKKKSRNINWTQLSERQQRSLQCAHLLLYLPLPG